MQHLSSGVDRIIVGTDFTSLSQTAFEAAVRAARLWGAELHILHAHEEDLYLRGRDGGEDMKGFVDELTSRRSGWLDTLKEAAQGAGASVQTVTRRGAASDAILAYADAIDAGLIVLGMGGGGGLKRLLTGSTARRVLRRSERPVMTVSAQAFVAPATTRPGEPASPAEAGTFRHILYPTDLTAVSRDGLAAAVQLVRKAGARLTVAHVLKMPGVVPGLPGEPTVMLPRGAVDGLAEHVQDQLEAWTADLGLDEVATVVTTRTDAAEGIAEVAARVGADLIAIPRRSTRVAQFLFGSTAEQVAKIAPAPVLAFSPALGARPA